MSVISGTVGAITAAGSANDALNANTQNIQNTNAQNLQEYLQSRGSTGSAILPIYATDAEQQMYGDTLGAYNATGALTPTAAQLQSYATGAAPAAQGAVTAAGSVFNGSTLNSELQQQQPVSAATLALAQTQKQGTLEALQQTLNNIKSIQAGKGYSGDSYQNSLLGFQARQQANTQGAQAVAGANLTNAKSVQGIQENSVNRELANLNAPLATAQNQMTLANAPANALEQAQVNRQNLFSNFRIGTGQPFQYQNVPTVQPNSAVTGALAQAGAGEQQIGSSLIKALSSGNSGSTAAAGASNFDTANAYSGADAGGVDAAASDAAVSGSSGELAADLSEAF